MSSRADERPPLGWTIAAVASLSLPVGVVALVYGHVEREHARARWAEVSRHVGEPGYDPEESDRRYLDVEAWNDWTDVGWRATGVGAAGLVGVLIGRRRRAR